MSWVRSPSSTPLIQENARLCLAFSFEALQSGRGEIGRHTRFRFWRREVWEFESPRPHHLLVGLMHVRWLQQKTASQGRFLVSGVRGFRSLLFDCFYSLLGFFVSAVSTGKQGHGCERGSEGVHSAGLLARVRCREAGRLSKTSERSVFSEMGA